MRIINNTKWILVFCLLCITGNSCTDILDEAPSDLIYVDKLLNSQAIGGFRDNSYLNLNRTFHSHFSNQLLDAYTDDGFRAGTGTPYLWHNGLLTPERNMFASTIWAEYWQGIRRTNNALVYIPQSKAPEVRVPKVTLDIWMSEVRLLRAWYYFELIRHFGPVPIVESPIDVEFQDWSTYVRPTYEQVVTWIVQEIDQVIADNKLELRWASSSDYDKLNMAAAYALKSRVLLYNASVLNNPGGDAGKWQRAALSAQQCLDVITPAYQLLPMSQYSRLFFDGVGTLNSEVILRSTINGESLLNENNGVDLRGVGSALQSSNAGTVPTQELVDAFELLDGTLPVASYNNPTRTDVTFNTGYNEAPGSNPYAGRDARLYHAIVFNGSNYGRYKAMPAGAPDIIIYTYDGKPFTGFNSDPLSEQEADVRRSATGYYSRKYRTAGYWGSTAGSGTANKVYFRLAEIYLNLAEAHCELGNLEDAMTALNVVRNRAGQPNIQDVPGFVSSQEFLRHRIRNERRVELCFEDHRFYDQRRWRILAETNHVVSGMRVTSSTGTDAGPFSFQRIHINVTRNANSQKYLALPIPIEEARRLPGLGQPAGY